MKFVSWNVNGLRAVHRKGIFNEYINKNPDFLCLQETKARYEDLPPEVANPPGYYTFFDFPEEKKGYSGVAIYTKYKPDNVKLGLNNADFDKEGRVINLFFGNFVLINIYFPNGGGGPNRLKYKMDFYEVFLRHIIKLKKEGKRILFCGDVNTAHKEIDLARPKANEKNTGFLPEEREWIDRVLKSGFVDVFRFFYPNKKEAYTYWDIKSRARDRNVGWRIDYFFASENLIDEIKGIEIENKIEGSDHCPISLESEPIFKGQKLSTD